MLYKSAAALRRSRRFDVVDRVSVLVALVVVVNTLPHFLSFFIFNFIYFAFFFIFRDQLART